VDPHSYQGLIPFDRWVGISPSGDVANDFDRPLDFGLPQYYQVSAPDRGKTFRVHCSRVLRFLGPEVPKPEFQAQMYWGISVLEPAYEAIRMFDNSLWAMLQLLFRANIIAQENPDLAEMLSGVGISQDALQGFWERMQAQNQMMSNQSMMILPKDGKLFSIQYSFSGLEGVIQQYIMVAAGASEMPATRLFGRTMTGLGQSNDADERYYEERIAHDQASRLKPQLMKLYPVIAMSTWGEIPEDLDFTFPSIRVLTQDEKAEMAQKASAPIIAAFNVGAYGRKTLLKELKQLEDSTGMFSNITRETIDAASDEPEQQGEMGGMMGMGGGGPELPTGGPEDQGGGEGTKEGAEGPRNGSKREQLASGEGGEKPNYWPAFGKGAAKEEEARGARENESPKKEMRKLSAGASGRAVSGGMRELSAGASDSEMPKPDAEGTEEDVAALMEHRSFGLVGKRPGERAGTSFAVYQRHGGNISVLVRFLDGKVRDATLTENASETGKEPRVQTKKGFQGLFQFAQTVGDQAFMRSDLKSGADAYPIKKRLVWHGLDVSVETPAGDERTGKDAAGRPWRVVMTHDYGYLRGTRGVDGDHVDVFVGPDKRAEMVYVVHTMKAPEFQDFDEDKCFLDFATDGAARTAFFSNYDRPEHFGSMDAVPVGEFIDKVLATRKRPASITADERSWGRRLWDAMFKESEHPREKSGAGAGQFTSGAGASSKAPEEPVSTEWKTKHEERTGGPSAPGHKIPPRPADKPQSQPAQKSETKPSAASGAHPFVGTFLKEHKSTTEQREHLSTVPKEKLHVALKLTEGKEDTDSKHVRKLVESELEERANRGDSADSDVNLNGDLEAIGDADFEESAHPRAKEGEKGGQFVKKGGEGGAGRSPKAGEPAEMKPAVGAASSTKLDSTEKEMLQDWGFDKGKYAKLRNSDEFTNVLAKMPKYSGDVTRGAALSAAEIEALKRRKSGTAEGAVEHDKNIVKFKLHSSSTPSAEFGQIAAATSAAEHGKIPVVFSMKVRGVPDVSQEVYEEPNMETVIPKGTEFYLTGVTKKTIVNGDGEKVPGYEISLYQKNE
jgi:phage-related protein (TIGR01555 family)